MSPKKQLQYQLKTHPATRYVIGYSGGRDSHVLLDCLYQLRQAGLLTTPMIAIHVNHRLQKSSEHWARHCQKVCEDYGIELITETVTEKPKAAESIEAFAREQRYALIEKHLADGDIFLSAHHQRDQAETFLLQLMRGAGLDGLQAMPVMKAFGAGQYLRPLLNMGYEEIVAYAEANQLNFITDDSNNNTRFNRNYIRHEVLPILKQRFPQAEKSIARSAAWLGEVPMPNVPDKLYLPRLRDCSLREQKQQIRDYCKAKIGQALSKTQTDYILNHHLTAGADKQPQLNVGDYVIRRYNDELVVTAVLPRVGGLVPTKITPICPQSVEHGQAPPSLRGTTLGVTWQSPTTLKKTLWEQQTFFPVAGDCLANTCVFGWINFVVPPRNDDVISKFNNSADNNEVCSTKKDCTLFLSDKTYFGKLTWQTGQGGLPPKTYQLKPLQGSMRFHPHTRSHSTTVKKLLHEAGIAPWLRPFWLGLFDGEELVAIPNVGVAKKTFQKNTNALIPLWLIDKKFVKM